MNYSTVRRILALAMAMVMCLSMGAALATEEAGAEPAPVPTEAPEPEPTATPTPEPTPAATPEPAKAPDPTPEPEPTEAPAAVETPAPADAPVPPAEEPGNGGLTEPSTPSDAGGEAGQEAGQPGQVSPSTPSSASTPSNAPVAAAQIKLNYSLINMLAGGRAYLTAGLFPEGASGEISWSSSDASVASVTKVNASSVIVTANKAGTAVITAKCGEITAACTIKAAVPAQPTAASQPAQQPGNDAAEPAEQSGSQQATEQPEKTLTIHGATTAMTVGDICVLSAEAENSGEEGSYEWRSSHPDILKITASGDHAKVAALRLPEGDDSAAVTITASYAGLTASRKITVTLPAEPEAPAEQQPEAEQQEPPVETATPSTATATPSAASLAVLGSTRSTTATVAVGGNITLTAPTTHNKPGSNDACTSNTFNWASNAEGIATVANGTVTGVAAGTATITATCNAVDCNATTEYSVTVNKIQPNTSLNYSELTLKPGGTGTSTISGDIWTASGSVDAPTACTYALGAWNNSSIFEAAPTIHTGNGSIIVALKSDATPGAIATATVTITPSGDATDTHEVATATITVNVATVTSISVSGQKTVYDWGASAWDVTGGKVTVNWSNGESSSPIDLTADMITTPVSVLSQIGEHDVKVKHLEQEATFKVTVNAPAAADVGATPAAGATGVTEGDNITDSTPDDNTNPKLNVTSGASNLVSSTDGSIGVKFTLSGGTLAADKTMTVQIPYPAGTDKTNYTFIAKDATSSVGIQATDNGLLLTINGSQLDKDISVGWTKKAATPADPPCRPWVSPQERFWRDVANAIWRSCPGSVIRVSAPGNWQVPASVMRALYSSRDVTLVIRTPAGDRISINSDDAIGPHYSHRGYPIAWLRQMYDNDSDRKSGSSGGGKVTTLAKTPEKEAAKPEPAAQEPVQQPVEAAPEPIKAGEPAPAKPEPAPEPAQPAPEAEQPEAVAAAASAGGNTGMTVLIAAIAFVGGAIAALAVKMKKKSE